MGTRILDSNGGGADFAPTALMKEKDAMIKGVLVARRLAKTQYGDKPVYSLTVLDASCKFTQGKGQEVSPEEGATVDLFASTRLERQLCQVAMGKTVTIKYAGTKKIGKGMPAHVYDVTLED